MIGLGVFDCLARELPDPDSGDIYPALSCCNNQEMASRCSTPNAPRVIWSIKASAQFNSDCAFLLRDAFRSGRIRLLINEFDAEENLKALKGYGSLSPSDKFKLSLPYVHTTLLIDELTKLEYEEVGGRIKIHERYGMRKDRYSSLAYNYYVAMQLESKLIKKQSFGSEASDMFVIKPPQYKRKAVNRLYGGTNRRYW